MSFFVNIFTMIKYFNNYVEERSTNVSDLIEKGLYFDTEKYKDMGYIEIKVDDNDPYPILSIKI